MKALDDFERGERAKAYHRWFRRQAATLGFYDLPPHCRAVVGEMLRKAYTGGADNEREQQEPIRVGGDGWN